MLAAKSWKRPNGLKGYFRAAFLMIIIAAPLTYLPPPRSLAAEQSLLSGRVTSSSKEPLAGVPVRAHREDSNITVTVYTNSRGEYSFPEWADVSPGPYSIAIELPDLEHFNREHVTLSAQKNTRLDFSLQPRRPTINDALTSEIAMGEPGTDDQRFLLTQCSECHSLQWALANPRLKEDWLRIVRLMAGPQVSKETPGTRQFMQKQYIQPLAEYLASIRGPGAPAEIPFKLRPRPTGEASTRIVVTEYDIPRGGTRNLYLVRGAWDASDWPHDLVVDSKYVWYTDHYSYLLGRLDKKTGEIKEYPYEGRFPGREPMEKVPPGAAHQGVLFGSHKMVLDSHGNILWGMPGATFRFDPKTEKFTHWPAGENMFGIDPTDNIWWSQSSGSIHKLDTKTGEVKEYKIPSNDGEYDQEVDSKGRVIINIWRGGKTGVIGLFDPKTERYAEYPTPSPGSGPRRGHVDAKDREWVGEFWAGRLGMFDANTGEVKEFPLVPDSKPFGPPFVAPYTAAVDDKNQVVWVPDFNSNRLFLFDIRTEKPTEFYMPLPYEVRDMRIDKDSDRPTVWIPAHRPPSKMVKVQLR